jgi:hypothetical protein
VVFSSGAAFAEFEVRFILFVLVFPLVLRLKSL